MEDHNISENNRLEFVIEAYSKCFESKHHYDSLSWTVAGISLVFVGAILAYIPNIKSDTYCLAIAKRLILGFFAWIVLWLWYQIYERNRFWAEVANEQARKFERKYNVEGAGIAFMKAALSKQLLFENTDEQGKTVVAQKIEKCKRSSVHHNVRYLIWALVLLVALDCLIP